MRCNNYVNAHGRINYTPVLLSMGSMLIRGPRQRWEQTAWADDFKHQRGHRVINTEQQIRQKNAGVLCMTFDPRIAQLSDTQKRITDEILYYCHCLRSLSYLQLVIRLTRAGLPNVHSVHLHRRPTTLEAPSQANVKVVIELKCINWNNDD